MKKFTFIISCFVSLIFNSLSAQVLKYSNEFLSIGVGSRALGMGQAVTASTDDVSSGYWNPAGLGRMKTPLQATFMHSEYFAGIAKYDYGAVAKTIDSSSAFSFSVVRFGVDDIPNTINLINSNGQIDYSKITRFSAQDYGFFLSYGRKLKIEGLQAGGSFKIVRRTIGDFAGCWGIGLDGGLQYQKNKWQFGFMGRDITTTINSWSYNLDDRTKEVFTQTGNEIPENSTEITAPKLVFAAGRSFQFKKFNAYLEANANVTTDGYRNTLIKSKTVSVDPQVGLELSYSDIVRVRGGINNIQEVRNNGQKEMVVQPNFGLGVRIFNVYLDYALTNVGEATGLLSHVFSLKFHFQPKQVK
jgi:hypothetical protein